jgi:hypothetical protein
MIASEAGYPADAIAAEESQVLLVQKNEFLALLKTQRELAFRLLRAAGQRCCVRRLPGATWNHTCSRITFLVPMYQPFSTPSTAFVAAHGPTRIGRIISLSSCSTMWQCQTNWPGRSNVVLIRVTWPG